MRPRSDLHVYQERSVEHMIRNPYAALHVFMGAGKTAATLTAIVDLFDRLEIKAALVVAPKRVIEAVWRQEAKKWEHTRMLTFSLIAGDIDDRMRAVRRPANVYLVSYDNLMWLYQYMEDIYLKKGKYFPFDMVVYDEISKLKNARVREGTSRGKAGLKLLPYVKRRVGLTGTPASNGLLDLFGQYLVLDGGERLGRAYSDFRQRYFVQADFKGYRYEPAFGAEKAIAEAIGDITLTMRMEDYLDMPELIVNDILLSLPSNQQKKYDELEKNMILELQSGKEVEAFSKASMINRTRQFANGAVYVEPGQPEWENLHDIKLKALEDIIDEANGEPVLCSFEFQHDAHKILKKFPDAVWFSSKLNEKDALQAIEDFKEGKLRLLLGHPACLAGDTEVLTEYRGWVPITDVRDDDRVHDGVDFVPHDGCVFSGTKNTIEVFGVRMTENHKLLIGEHWETAKNVRTDRKTRRMARFTFREAPENVPRPMYELRSRTGDEASEFYKAQPRRVQALSKLQGGKLSQYDENPTISDMARDEIKSVRPFGQRLQKLFRKGYKYLQRMDGVQKLLSRYEGRVSGRSYYRENRQLERIQQRELPMGNQYGTASQQEEQSEGYLQREVDTSCGAMQANRDDERKNNSIPEQVWEPERRQSGNVGVAVPLRKKEKVYDLVNCGPRNRFLIRNREGEIFISHNSMGHGLDGLQGVCYQLVMYGLNWSLDLYDQTIARIWRQGQKRPVVVHRLIMDNTTDLAVDLALKRKAQDETGIKQAVMEYWEQKAKGLHRS